MNEKKKSAVDPLKIRWQIGDTVALMDAILELDERIRVLEEKTEIAIQNTFQLKSHCNHMADSILELQHVTNDVAPEVDTNELKVVELDDETFDELMIAITYTKEICPREDMHPKGCHKLTLGSTTFVRRANLEKK